MGITWTYTKDVTDYLSLWKQPNKVVFDLGNLIDDRYTGRFNTTLTATFFTSEIKSHPADLVIPISKSQSAANQSSAFLIPQDGKARRSISLPRNAKRAVFGISAVGQGQEEFWWSNVPQSRVATFGEKQLLPGLSPWREVQVLIDDKLAGVAWPFPVIFTGGVIPSFWRPVVGIDAFDMREDEIDITPWLPALSDGKEHAFEIQVVGLIDDGRDSVTISPVGNNWVVTGKVFLWLDQPGAITTGDQPKIMSPNPNFTLQQSVTQGSDGKNSSLSFNLTASRILAVEGNVITSDGPKVATWRQDLQFRNYGMVEEQGNSQRNEQMTTGTETSSRNYTRRFQYPLLMHSSGSIDEITRDIDIKGNFTRGKTVLVTGDSTFPTGLENYINQLEPGIQGCIVNNTQKGEAMIRSAQNVTKGMAVTEQAYTFNSTTSDFDFTAQHISNGDSDLMYSRHVLARNDRLVSDEELTREASPPLPNLPNRFIADERAQVLDITGIETMIGRKYAYLLNSPYQSSNPIEMQQQPLAIQKGSDISPRNSGVTLQAGSLVLVLSCLSFVVSAILL